MSHLQLAFQHLQFLLMKTFHRAAAVVSPIIADRLRRILLHPAATENWTEAMALAGNLDVPVETAVRALDTLAGASTAGRRAAN